MKTIKKSLMMLLLMLCLLLIGCSDDIPEGEEGEVTGTITPEQDDETPSATPTEEPTEAPTPTEEPSANPPEEDLTPTPEQPENTTPPVEPEVETPSEITLARTYTNMNNVWYNPGTDWKYHSDVSGTILYTYGDSTDENISFFVQNETAYSAAVMKAAYEAKFTEVYGSAYEKTEYVVEYEGSSSMFSLDPMKWSVYSYGTDNLLSDLIGVDIYLYSDGATTIYIENAYLDSTGVSGAIEEFLKTILIEK